MYPISESIVFLTRNLQGPGNKVHHSLRNELVTLYYTSARLFTDNQGNNLENDGTLRISVGNRDFCITLKTNQKIENLPVFKGEEIWVSTTTVNVGAIYGTCIEMSEFGNFYNTVRMPND
jgi:hypothetical protein